MSEEKPTFWQRITGGVKNFFSHAFGYIPRGIVLTGVVFAASAVIESMTYGTVGLGIAKLSSEHLLGRFVGHLALGSLISGVIGASTAPCTPCQQGADSLHANNPLLSKREAQLGEYMAKTVTDHATNAAVEAVAPGGGIPAQFIGAAAKAVSGTAR